MSVVIRRGRADEADALARLYRQTVRQSLPFLPTLHTPEADAAFFRQEVLVRCAVWVATDADEIVGFCAVRRGWIDHLYVAPKAQGRGVGRALLRRALAGRRRVRLWAFQRNVRARAFYRAAGFVEVMLTDGAANEETEPDVLLQWRP